MTNFLQTNIFLYLSNNHFFINSSLLSVEYGIFRYNEITFWQLTDESNIR